MREHTPQIQQICAVLGKLVQAIGSIAKLFPVSKVETFWNWDKQGWTKPCAFFPLWQIHSLRLYNPVFKMGRSTIFSLRKNMEQGRNICVMGRILLLSCSSLTGLCVSSDSNESVFIPLTDRSWCLWFHSRKDDLGFSWVLRFSQLRTKPNSRTVDLTPLWQRVGFEPSDTDTHFSPAGKPKHFFKAPKIRHTPSESSHFSAFSRKTLFSMKE